MEHGRRGRRGGGGGGGVKALKKLHALDDFFFLIKICTGKSTYVTKLKMNFRQSEKKIISKTKITRVTHYTSIGSIYDRMT